MSNKSRSRSNVVNIVVCTSLVALAAVVVVFAADAGDVVKCSGVSGVGWSAMQCIGKSCHAMRFRAIVSSVV